MKFSLCLALFTLSASAFADFAAFSRLNHFKILNDAGKLVFQADSSTVKKVDLREDLAGFQSTFDNLTVVDKSGRVIIKEAFASSYRITSKYIAALGGKQLKVFNRQGNAFISKSWVAAAAVSNTMIAYREDRVGSTLFVLNEQGEEIFSEGNNVEAMLSDNFVFTKDQYGWVSLYDKAGNRLEYSNALVSYSLSDSFAAFTDNFGFTKIINDQGDTLVSGFNMKVKALLNNALAYEENNQTFVLNKKAEQTFWSSSAVGNIQVLDNAMAFRDNMNMVRFYSPIGASITTTNVQTYFLTNNLLGYQTGPSNFAVFTFNKFKIFEENNSDLAGAAVSPNLFMLKTKTNNGLRLYNASGVKLVTENSVQDFWITTSKPDLNWDKF